MDIFGGQRFFIYGNGVSGRSALRAIKRRGGRARIYTDGPTGFTAPQDGEYRAAIISPGIRRDHAVYAYCRDRGIRVMGEAELGMRLSDVAVVGVTGTNGKTTTTRLIASMLGGTACGNIGYPITTAIDRPHGTLVCELSSFQLCGAEISPRAAVITNMSPDHIDWHGSAEEYYRCKCNIARNMSAGALVIGEDVTVGALAGMRTGASLIRTSTTCAVDGAYIEGGYFKYFGERVCPVGYLRLPGRHNLRNALCAIAAAKYMGADNTAVLKAMSTAENAPHRLCSLGSVAGKTWVDDSKGTNVSACLAAIDAMCGKVCLIVGGRDKGLDFTELFCALPQCVTDVVAMGESANALYIAAKECGIHVAVVKDLAAAVRAAACSSADTVLLSPACASFDEFKSYAERGERFAAEVSALRSR